MIRLENTEVQGWEAAIRGMRNPMNSWGKSDSKYESKRYPVIGYSCPVTVMGRYHIGPVDLALMKKLAKAGSDHRKFLRFITVTVDITAPLYWWKEFDTYKVGTVANSFSTMHKIHSKEFELDDFSHEYLTYYASDGELYRDWLGDLEELIDDLNLARTLYLETKDKKYWWQMIQLLPSSYNQRRTVLMNYEVLRNMYHARKAHKLDEWRVGFCGWVKSLPYAELITGGADDDGTGEGQT